MGCPLYPGASEGCGHGDEEGQVFILHLAIGKQKGAGGISNAECGVKYRSQETEFRIKTEIRNSGIGDGQFLVWAFSCSIFS
jgi:hypothetical protein